MKTGEMEVNTDKMNDAMYRIIQSQSMTDFLYISSIVTMTRAATATLIPAKACPTASICKKLVRIVAIIVIMIIEGVITPRALNIPPE